MNAAARPPVHTLVPEKVRVYLQGSVSSLTTAPSVVHTRVQRHDMLLLIAAPGSRFMLRGGGIDGAVQAVAIGPQVRHVMQLTEGAIAIVAVHLVHPRFKSVLAGLDAPVRKLPREAFAHLDERLRLAHGGELDVDEATDLVDDALDILLTGAPQPRPVDARVRWMMRRIEADLHVSFDALANELSLSPSRLSHLFSKELGVSFRSYVAWGRLRVAWEMVVFQPDFSLQQIAQRLGYADVAHLSRSFSNCFGITPTWMRTRDHYEMIGYPMPPGRRVPPETMFEN